MVKILKASYICPVCSSKKNTYFLTAFHAHGKDALDEKTFKYFQCKECHSVFLVDTKFTKNYYHKYYNFDGYYTESSGLKKSIEKVFDVYSQKNKQGIVNTSAQKTNKKIKLLDVGAGEGKFLSSLDSNMFEKYGVELDKKSYEICKRKKLTVYNEDIIKMDFKTKKFDVITLWHVIEHIPNPQKLIKKLATLLTTNGRIIVATPNIDSKGFQIAKEKWFHMDAPRHVILYSESGIKKLVKRNDFVIESVQSERYEFPLDLFWSMKQAKKNAIMFPFLKMVDKETLTYVIKKSHTN